MRLLVVTAAVALLMEGFFRYALFVDDPVTRFLVRSVPALRKPQSYASTYSTEYWKLHYVLVGAGKGEEANYDPLLGWRPGVVRRDSYRNRRDVDLGARRPVLLFGDSFGGCVTEEADCWQGLLARSDLADRYLLLNFAVGGYGFDQIALLCRQALPNYVDQRPVVVVSLLVDDDLDRSMLEFRAWPKPRMRLDEDGALQRIDRELPRLRDVYIEREGIGITSYAWRFACFATPLVPGWRQAVAREHLREAFALNRAILEELVVELDASGCEYFFLLFHGRTFLRERSPLRARDEFVIGELERLGAPYVLSREALRTDAARTGREEAEYFYASGTGKGHYTPLGNKVVFRALRAGILGEYDGGPMIDDLASARVELDGEGAVFRFEDSAYPPFDDAEDQRRLLVRVGVDGPTRATWRLARGVARMTGIVKRTPARDTGAGRVELRALADGRELFRAVLEPDAEPQPLALDLTGVRELTLVASDGGDGAAGDVLYIASPAFVR